MENQEQATPTSIFSALGLENPTPTPVEISEEPTPSFEPTATPDGGEPAPIVDTTINDDTTFKASDLRAIFGDFESIDSIKQKYSGFEERAKKYDEFEPLISQQESLMKELESPFANEKLAGLNSFIRNTGINDLDVASKFVGKTSEEIKQTPIQVMALAQVIQEPDLLNNMSFEDLCEAIADENSTYADVTFEDAPKVMKMKIGKNIAIVEEKLQNIGQNKDFVASLRNQYNESKETVAKAVQEWKPTIEKLTDLKEVEYDLEGYKVKAQVSAETRTQLQKEITNIIASNPSLPDDQSIELINTYVRSRIENLEAANIYKSLISAAKGEALEKSVKEFHNGSSVARPEKQGGNNEKSQLLQYFEGQI
jgi:hypothetical protein